MKYKYNNEWNTITKDGAPGKDGKSAYEYAKQGGYTGTEEEFAEKLAEEIDVSGFMSKTNPAGTGSFSLNRKPGSAVGSNSHAEGYYNTASGNFSHAEGNSTIASVICSHAEGASTTAQGNYSHAEGRGTIASGNFSHVQGKYNIADFSDTYADIIGNGSDLKSRSNAATVDWSGNAWYAGDVYVGSTSGTNKDEGSKKLATEESVSGKMDKNNPTGAGSFSLNRRHGTIIGQNSHAEGSNTTASGYSSHAEGFNTTASEINSHAEGYMTTASGNSSHAEGYNTKASSPNQHAQGRYNVEDSYGVYADIIGNGNPQKKSNAATVDWSGNAWYAGDVYIGSTSGTNKDEGSKKLATEEYVDNKIIVPAPSSADEEKVLRVVGGKATWVSLPSASGVSF